MKLTAQQIGMFLQKPDPSVRVALVYGPDAGLVRERAEHLARKAVADINDPFATANLPGSAITEDPARLHDEMASQSLGGGKRLVRIQQATEGMAQALDALLKDLPAADSFLVIEGGDLEKRSKLRALCENDPHAAAIPCYVEEGAVRQRAISDILQEAGFRITRDALALLAESLPPDRMAMRSELDKLTLYARDPKAAAPKPITVEDVQAVVQDAGQAELDELIFAVGGGDVKRAMRLLDRLWDEQTSPVTILRAAQRHFLRLQWARGQMESGLGASDAIKKLQPPVFWKHAESMTAQLRRWPAGKIAAALSRLYEAEAAVKRTGAPDQALTARLLLNMAA